MLRRRRGGGGTKEYGENALFDFEQALGDPRLTNDAQQSPATNRPVHRNGNGDCSGLDAFLHDTMASALANLSESVVLKDQTKLIA